MRRLWLALASCSYDPSSLPIDATLAVDSFEAGRDCPPEYTLALSGQTSRYRLVLTAARAADHSDDCANDHQGVTHLAAIDSVAELDQIELTINAIGNLANNRVWIGGVQSRNQAGPRDGWLAITGGPLLDAAWGGGEPNDTGGNEDNGENFAGIERNRDGLVDFPTGDSYAGVCECDGKPVDPTAAAAVDANR